MKARLTLNCEKENLHSLTVHSSGSASWANPYFAFDTKEEAYLAKAYLI